MSIRDGQVGRMGYRSNNSPWWCALHECDDELIKHLVQTESPATVIFQIVRYIMEVHVHLVHEVNWEELKPKIARAVSMRQQVRSWFSWLELRQIDLQVMRELYMSNALMVVLGAGATVDAGGPDWSNLVRQLLLTALEPERQARVPVPKRGGGWYFLEGEAVDRVDREGEQQARRCFAEIEKGTTDTELLKNAAQLCADLFQERLPQWLTAIIYESAPGPSEIHRAVAELARKPNEPDPGWVEILTYNFDNLMGEALEELRRPHMKWMMRDGRAYHTVPQADTEIIHLHGYSPRELMDIRGVEFVFSTSQYATAYRAEQPTLLNTVSALISKPDLFAVYVGCSFDDEAMNNLLRRAARRCAGTFQYALLRLPDRLRGELEVSSGALAEEETRYLDMGVQPVWFRKFEEIPNLIRQLV